MREKNNLTKYESQVLQIINSSYDHLTAEEVFLKLKQTEHKVVLATIYNNLNRLLEKGEIVKLSIEGQPDRFDRNEKHDHLICSICGEIQDHKFSDLKSKLEQELGTTIDGYDLKVRYVCPKCRAR